VRKAGHKTKHLRHACLDSCLDYKNNIYNLPYHGCSSNFVFPFLSQDMNEEGRAAERMNGVKSQRNV
jgi:hypothetical protein